MYNLLDISSINNYINKCNDKLVGIRKHKSEDDCRNSTKHDLNCLDSYWSDELTMAIEDKTKLEEKLFLEKGLNYSNNN